MWSILLFLRITKPGGHLCFTHFAEPGEFIGSILQPVEKGFWLDLAKNYGLLELKMKPMTNDQEMLEIGILFVFQKRNDPERNRNKSVSTFDYNVCFQLITKITFVKKKLGH